MYLPTIVCVVCRLAFLPAASEPVVADQTEPLVDNRAVVGPEKSGKVVDSAMASHVGEFWRDDVTAFDSEGEGVPVPSPLILFETPAPLLVGGYGGFLGGPWARSSGYDFGQRFIYVRSAWLVIEMHQFDLWFLEGIEVELNGVLNARPQEGERGLINLPLDLPTEGIRLDGTGTVGLHLNLGCCDLMVFVYGASVRFEGIGEESPASLFGFADFSMCFGSEIGFDFDECATFDANGDSLVDLVDYSLIYSPAAEP